MAKKDVPKKDSTLAEIQKLVQEMQLPEKRPICENHKDQVVTNRARDCHACWTELEFVVGHFTGKFAQLNLLLGIPTFISTEEVKDDAS